MPSRQAPNEAAFQGLGTGMRVLPTGAYYGHMATDNRVPADFDYTRLRLPTFQVGATPELNPIINGWPQFPGGGWFGPTNTAPSGIGVINRDQTRPGQEQVVFNLPTYFKYPPKGIIRWATANANWTDAADDYVTATDDETGEVLTIYLPATRPGTPNVRNGAELTYMIDVDGLAVCTSDYMDDKLATVKMWSGTFANIPAGWQICDGTNSSPDLRGKFVQGSDATGSNAGTTGGTSTHAHTITGSTATESLAIGGSTGTQALSLSGSTANQSVTISGNTAYATTGLTIDGSGTLTSNRSVTGLADHPSHTHDTVVPGTTATAGVTTGYGQSGTFTSGGPSVTLAHSSLEPNAGAGHDHTINTHTHTITEPTNGGAGTGHLHAAGTLTGSSHSHTAGTLAVSPDPHSHTGASLTLTPNPHSHTVGTLVNDTINHLPPFYIIMFIYRVN